MNLKNNSRNNQIQSIHGDLKSSLLNFSDNYFGMATFTHFLKYLSNSEEIFFQHRRVVKDKLIIICPFVKEYKWGMNYQLKFFPTQKYFVDF